MDQVRDDAGIPYRHCGPQGLREDMERRDALRPGDNETCDGMSVAKSRERKIIEAIMSIIIVSAVKIWNHEGLNMCMGDLTYKLKNDVVNVLLKWVKLRNKCF